MTHPLPSTLVEGLRRSSSAQPDHTAFVFLADGENETARLTLGTLDRQARAVAARLQALAAPGDRAVMIYGPGLEFIPALYGCLYAGVVAVPVIPPRPNQPAEAFANLLADARPTVVVTTAAGRDALSAQLGAGLSQTVAWLATDTVDEAEAEAWRETAPEAEDLAVLLYTSGSTSVPKGVMLTHKSLLGRAMEVPAWVDASMKFTSVGWMPHYHIGGLAGLTFGIGSGALTTYLLPAEAVVERPRRWLAAITRYRAVTSGGPNFLYQLCVDRIPPAEREGLDLSLWFFATCGAEPIRAETLEQFAAAYAPYGFRREAFIPAYGLSEASQGVAGRPLDGAVVIRAFDQEALARGQAVRAADDAPHSLKLVSSGRAGPVMDVRIVDPATGQACPPGQIGEVWAASDYLSRGYWGRPDATAETFGARLASGEGPFLRTGDLAFIDDGELFIAGRLKEVMIVRGRKYHAQDIEAAAAGSHPDLGTAAAAFSVPVDGTEQIVLYHEVRPDCPAPEVEAVSAAIRQAVSKAMQLPLYAIALVEAGTLPRTAVGKIQRYLCREQFLEDMAASAHG